ncbi:site-specific integrase [Coprococcus sp. AM14-16]|uniref:tyrosine-type recombinase/integrase n=1 Tax=Coprococcus TaxID=33042 RepID=UPI000E411FAE|nr:MULTISPECIES: site-specific integrase [Coprococcus]RGD40685.1 site-specific integrase [Coprococcus sp. AM14-16]
MGKSLKGKELGVGISQQTNGLYVARFTDRFGRRKSKRFKKLQECRQWIADATYIDEHSDLKNATDMLVDAWFEYWIDLKKKTVRPNTVRNYSERYERNIKNVIGNKLLTEVKPIHCQKIFSDMADEGYKTTTIYQTRIALYNMLEFAKENEVIITNPCKKSVKSDIGKPSDKKEALTIDDQRRFLAAAKGQSYEYQYRFALQTGLRTGELVGLKWEDINFERKTLTIERSMEFRYKVGEWRVGPPKSKSGYRTIPLTDEAICILKAQKEKNRKLKVIDKEWADTVFLCRKGQPVKNSTYDTALFKICDKAGIKRFSMHVLRHTFATRCIEGGMMPKTLQKILGHSNIGITMNLYVHITEEEKQKEIDLVAEALKAGVAI